MKSFLTSLALVSLALVGAGALVTPQSALRDRSSSPAPGSPAFPTFVLEGIVLGPAGSPEDRAVVVTTAGGQVVTGPDGRYRLELAVDVEARDLRVTAIDARGSATASTNVGLPALPGIVVVEPLELAPESACRAQWLPTFGTEPGVDSGVFAMAVFDDGRGPALYVGGHFDYAGGVKVNQIARWNGWSWEDLDGGMHLDTKSECEVHALAVYDDGSGPALYAGGEFTSAGGVAANGIARWNGSRWSPLGPRIRRIGDSTRNGTTGVVRALQVFDDGNGPELYVGGWFVYAGGIEVNNIARWNGSGWSRVNTRGLSWGVNALAVFDDGNGSALHAGTGHNFSAGSRGIYRWNGTRWSELGGGIQGLVRALAAFDDGSGPALYAAGHFTAAGGVPALRIARWNGSAWTALGSGLDGGWVYDLAVFDDGAGPALYAGGGFTTAGGTAANHLARWNGASWSALASEPSALVRDLLVLERGGRSVLVAGGWFEMAGGGRVNRIATWNGARWSALGSGLDGWVHALAVHDDGRGRALFVGGAFTSADGALRNNIVRWDGARWSAVGSGVGSSPYTEVLALAVFDGGGGPALYAGGSHGIAKWDGASWSALGAGIGPSYGVVHALAVFDDGTGPALYVGGEFDTAGGVTVHSIARWNGSQWSALGSGIDNNGQVWALAVFDDGTGPALYAAGSFFAVDGVQANNIARWDGTSWSSVGNGMYGAIAALTVFDDGRGPALYAGGPFITAGTVGGVSFHIARWDGASWSRLGTGMDDTVQCLAVFDDGRGPALYAGGAFAVAGDVPARGLARWDGSSWSGLDGGPAVDMSGVGALGVFDGGLIAGGAFPTTVAHDSYLARWGCEKVRAR